MRLFPSGDKTSSRDLQIVVFMNIAKIVLSFSAFLGLFVTASASDSDLAGSIGRMARIGTCFSPTLSPDGKIVAFISNLSGNPQIWSVPAAGGWPTQVTAFD